jgi:hypothetical protein
MTEETDSQTPTNRPTGLPASAGSAFVVKQFVECPNCGKLWLYDGHAADVCCGGCSHNFYVPPDAMTRRLHKCESVLRSVVKNVPIMAAGFGGTLLHSKCVALVGEQNRRKSGDGERQA